MGGRRGRGEVGAPLREFSTFSCQARAAVLVQLPLSERMLFERVYACTVFLTGYKAARRRVSSCSPCAGYELGATARFSLLA